MVIGLILAPVLLCLMGVGALLHIAVATVGGEEQEKARLRQQLGELDDRRAEVEQQISQLDEQICELQRQLAAERESSEAAQELSRGTPAAAGRKGEAGGGIGGTAGEARRGQGFVAEGRTTREATREDIQRAEGRWPNGRRNWRPANHAPAPTSGGRQDGTGHLACEGAAANRPERIPARCRPNRIATARRPIGPTATTGHPSGDSRSASGDSRARRLGTRPSRVRGMRRDGGDRAACRNAVRPPDPQGDQSADAFVQVACEPATCCS